jgi:hypothetical protein
MYVTLSVVGEGGASALTLAALSAPCVAALQSLVESSDSQ